MRDNEDALKGYEIVLDVDAPRARSPYFPPIGAQIKSEVRLEHLTGRSNGALAMVGGRIPGQRLYFSAKTGHCKIVDRMTLSENRSIDEELRKLTRTDKFRHAAFGSYAKDIDISITKKELPTWLYWIKRLVDTKKLKVVSGGDKIPKTYEEILKLNGGKMIISEDYGLKPLSKDDQPFNVVSLEDFAEAGASN